MFIAQLTHQLGNVWFWFIFVLGLLVGSFLNVCILRIPHGRFWERSRSFCMACTSPIPMYLNIPVVSWLLLRGRAKCCGEKISVQYPLVELLTGIAFAGCFLKWAFISGGFADFHLDPVDQLRFTHAVIFISVMIVVSVIDIQLMIIPDVINFSMILLAPLAAYFHPELTLDSSVLGIIFGGLGLYAIAATYLFLRGEEGMGLGDVKLLAAIGGWVGYQGLIPTVIGGSLVGSLAGLGLMLYSRTTDLKTAIPFGPFLALGAVAYLLFGQTFYELILAGR
jgi:leader peptidase (prepilin peptidase)/N-methyltransferase